MNIVDIQYNIKKLEVEKLNAKQQLSRYASLAYAYRKQIVGISRGIADFKLMLKEADNEYL